MVPTIAVGALRKLLAHCDEHGIDRARLLAAIGVEASSLADIDARVPVATLHAAWDFIVANKGRADGALFAPGYYQPGDYGLVGFVVMTSATFAEALGHFIRFIGLWTDEPRFVLDGTTVRLEFRHAFADGPGVRISTEAAFTELVQGARMVSQTHVVPRAVRIAHPGPRDTSGHRAFFGCNVEFEARAHELEWNPEDLALPLPRGDAQLGAYLRAEATRALERRGDPDAIVERVRAIVAENLARELPSLDAVAKRLAVGTRTLRRRLADEGTSFRDLVDATRGELAKSYVRDRRIPLSEIAFMLGFSEASAFHRAFRRWTGTTPASWRGSTS